ncbi:peptidoglycan-associated lipoprotein Pal [Prosthecomicrobium sp. N25]|uniref:peptidoglycan-associated lipoprotein Pal n=1 Tax=Prosthecomicrobium sp. N25 TaxID=3129254 RepID=UPI0030773DEF
MSTAKRQGRAIRFATVIAAAIALSACASQNPSEIGAGAGGAATPGSQQDFVVNVGDRVFFTVDSSDLTPEARGTLDRQSTWLGRYPRYTITIEGHADERGTREYNISLGARRAAVTRDYLISRGVAPTRLRTISYGKERPVAVCDADTCWNQNRRAVTVLNGAGS